MFAFVVAKVTIPIMYVLNLKYTYTFIYLIILFYNYRRLARLSALIVQNHLKLN